MGKGFSLPELSIPELSVLHERNIATATEGITSDPPSVILRTDHAIHEEWKRRGLPEGAILTLPRDTYRIVAKLAGMPDPDVTPDVPLERVKATTSPTMVAQN